MDLMIQVQILDKTVCILLCTNALGKGTNPSLSSSAVGQTVLFSLGRAGNLDSIEGLHRTDKCKFLLVIQHLRISLYFSSSN